MKKIKDETVRLAEGFCAVLIAFILTCVYNLGVKPKWGFQATRAAFIVLMTLAALLFVFGVFSFVMYFVIRSGRRRREREQEERLNGAVGDGDKRISREDILPDGQSPDVKNKFDTKGNGEENNGKTE